MRFVFAFCFVVNLAPLRSGEIRGQVTAVRHPSKRIIAPAYSLRGGTVSVASVSETSSEIEKVVIFLDEPHLERAQPVTARMDQKDAHFVPDLVVAPVGSTVSFPNLDPIFHNVFSLSKARQFDLGYYPAGQTRLVVFDKPGVVQVFCHLHSNMSAAVVVVPNRYYTVPAPDGSFNIPDVPPGAYKLVVWHRANGLSRRRVVVPESGVINVPLEVPVKEEAGTP